MAYRDDEESGQSVGAVSEEALGEVLDEDAVEGVTEATTETLADDEKTWE